MVFIKNGHFEPVPYYNNGTSPNDSVYSDRLFQWDHAKHDELCQKHFGDVGQYWGQRRTHQIQSFLRDYLDKPELILCRIWEYTNQRDGYPVGDLII